MRKRIISAASVLASKGGPLAIQLAGIALVSAGFFILAVWLGLMVAGVSLLAIGWAMDGK